MLIVYTYFDLVIKKNNLNMAAPFYAFRLIAYNPLLYSPNYVILVKSALVHLQIIF